MERKYGRGVIARSDLGDAWSGGPLVSRPLAPFSVGGAHTNGAGAKAGGASAGLVGEKHAIARVSRAVPDGAQR
jgi:hypothetical protein